VVELSHQNHQYCSSPEIKIKASVVLADEKWFDLQTRESKIYAVPKKYKIVLLA